MILRPIGCLVLTGLLCVIFQHAIIFSERNNHSRGEHRAELIQLQNVSMQNDLSSAAASSPSKREPGRGGLSGLGFGRGKSLREIGRETERGADRAQGMRTG